MGDSADGPIRSRHAGEPSFEERLEAFVLRLGERIDLIQEAEVAGDLPGGAARARQLAAEARALGFPPLAAAAERSATLCETGEPVAARKSIAELTDVVRRVRLGHRGAA